MNKDTTININDLARQILDIIDNIEKSGLWIRKYFSNLNVPFDIRQYYRYLKKYKEV